MPNDQISLLWIGTFFTNNSPAKINHYICQYLLEDHDFQLHIQPYKQEHSTSEHLQLTAPNEKHEDEVIHAQVTIYNQCLPILGNTNSKHIIYITPWELNTISYPLIKDQENEIWVYSKYAKEFCIRSGIPEHKIEVIPLGVDETVFHHEVKPLKLEDTSSFRFLFVVRPSEQEAIDVLIKAYKQEFSAEDNVSLIIKKIDADIVNSSIQNNQIKIDYSDDPNDPKVVFFNQHLSEQEMAGLYKSCNCLVYPNIGDGFVLPVIESMACGTPAIVPRFGAALEFCDPNTSFIFPCKEESFEQMLSKNNDNPWWLQIEQSALKKMMRFVYEHPVEVNKRGKKASKKILSTATWKQTVNSLSHVLKELVQKKTIPNNDYYIHLLYGKQLYKVKRFEDSLKIFLDILSDYPDSLEAHYNTAIVYIQTENYQEAIRHLLSITRSLENKPNNFLSKIWSLLSVCYAKTHSIPAAINALKNASSINFLLHPQEVFFLKEALQKSTSASSKLYQGLGDFYFQLGNDFHAEELYMKALEYEGDQFAIIEALGKVYERINNIRNKTITHFSKTLLTTASPPSPSIKWNQLDAYPLNEPKELEHKRRKKWEAYFTNGNQVLEIQWCFNNIPDLKNSDQIYDGILLLVDKNAISPYQFLTMFKSCTKFIQHTGKIIILLESSQPLFKKIIEKIVYSLGWTIKETSNPDEKESSYFVLQKTQFGILWQSPVFNSSGYADEQNHFLAALRPYPLKIKILPIDFIPPLDQYPPHLKSYLLSLQNQQIHSPLIHYQAAPADAFYFPAAPISIGRTMFETNFLPTNWVKILNELTEIWVPSAFNLETFANAGVKHEKMKILPEPLDEHIYNPSHVHPYPLSETRSYKFLSVFDWSARKGWEILLRAYFEEFKEDEDVSLVLKVSKINEPNTNPLKKIQDLAKKLGLTKIPHVHIIQDTLSQKDMIRLYAAADCFVLPSRGEGWGRPYMEAMAMELPTIGTRWSGQQAFMKDDNSYLINIEGLIPVDPNNMPAHFHGHHWAEPSVDHLKTLMRYVYHHPKEAKQKGVKARKDLFPQFSVDTIGRLIYQRMDELVDYYYK